MSAEWPVRAMTAGDLDQVMALAAQLPTAPHWARAAYGAALDAEAAPIRVALVAEDAGRRIAGFVFAGLAPPEAELESIAVREGCQRQGLGRWLLAALVERLEEHSVETLHLEVRASNKAARAFYRAAGLSEAGTRLRYYADPVEDAVVLNIRIG